MNTIAKLPAGILPTDNNAEIFSSNDNLYMQHRGKTIPFNEWPQDTINVLWEHIREDVNLYCDLRKRASDRIDIIRLFCFEHMGEYDNIPDIDMHSRICNRESEFLKKLSKRELEIVRFAVQTENPKECEEELDITLNTLRTHLKTIYRKLGLKKGMKDLTRWACQHRIVTV